MPEAIEVELGGEEGPAQGDVGPGGGRGVWLLVGIGLGFAFSLLFNNAVGDLEQVNPGGTTTTSVAPASGVGAAIPDFPDGLTVLVSPGSGRALEVLTWPLLGEPFYRSIALGDIDLAGTAHFDASGQFLAATTLTPDGLVLRGGRPNTFGVVASGVSGFAWHDANPADLAWSKVLDELQIWVSEDAGQGELLVRAIGIGEVLSAFGDWGFAVTERTGVSDNLPTFRTHLLAPNGDLRGAIDGWVVASHGSGLLLIENSGELRVVTVDVPEDGIEIRVTDLAGDVVVGGEFSPSGDRFAVTSFGGVSVVNLETLDVTNHSIRAGSDSIDWTSDGRFLLVSGFRGVSVLDTETGEITSILESETTRSVASTPIGGP